MSCPNSNSPIDIDLNNIAGNCDLKCAYSFQYPTSSCIVINRGDYLSIKYDATSISPVKYNTIDYNVTEVRIYTPSIHSFNGSKVTGEVIIVHSSTRGTNPLLVCVPFTENNYNTDSSALLAHIINGASINAPADGETANINIDNFSLNSFIPLKQFFSYTGNHPYQPCIGNVDYIVFTPLVSTCYISTEALTQLNKIISANTYTIKTGPSLFVNSKGPMNGVGGEDIYIDCKPINKSEEEILITTTTSSTSQPITLESVTSNPIFQIVMGSLLFILIILSFNMLLKLLGNMYTGDTAPEIKPKLPDISKFIPKMSMPKIK